MPRSLKRVQADRPPAVASIAAEASARHDTLHYVLGNLGGKQKSWMTAGPASSTPSAPGRSLRPTRRPPVPSRTEPEPQQSPPQQSPQASDATRDNYPPSNSTSPLLANLVPWAGDPPRELQSPPAALPSPSPSEDARGDPAAMPAAHNHGRNAPASAAGRQASAGNRGPMSPSLAFQIQDGANRALQHQMVTQARAQQIHPTLTHQPQPSEPWARRPSNAPSSASASRPSSRPASRNQVRRVQSDQSRPRGDAQHPYGLPPAQQAPFAQAPSPEAALALLDRGYTAADCHHKLQSFLPRAGTLTRNDIGRIKLLQEAVGQCDWDYLAIHQIYCFSYTATLPRNLMRQDILSSARAMLGEILGPNTIYEPHKNHDPATHLSAVVLQFFADFPIPMDQLAMNWTRAYEHQQQVWLTFAERSLNYPRFKVECLRRGYPPLVRQLVFDVGITSVVLQTVVFTAILRHLRYHWGASQLPDKGEKFEREATEILRLNQSDFSERKRRRPEDATAQYDEHEKQYEMNTWGVQLKQLCNYVLFSLGRAPNQQQQIYQTPQLSPSIQAQHGQQHQSLWPQHYQQLPSNTSPMPSPNFTAPFGYTSFTNQSPNTVPTQQSPTQTAPHPMFARNGGRVSIPHGRRGPPTVAPQPSPTVPSAPSLGPLLPQPNVFLHQQREPNPACFALHEANLRSPILRAQSLRPTTIFQYVEGFLRPPTTLTVAGTRIEKWELPLSAEDAEALPKDLPGAEGEPPTRMIDGYSKLMRLRCAEWPSTKPLDEHSWVTADTSWIPYTYFTLNGVTLHPRRKIHYGKDLPIDLTSLLKQGDNTLGIAVVRGSKDEKYLRYLLAIELVGFASHETIKHDCLTSKVKPAAEVKDAIRKRLSGSNDSDDDDDMAIVQCNLTINLFDPFSASKICDIPVRSKACLHNDCFDLETFLNTRKKNNGVSAADVWRCPICNADARPQHLLVDGFLQEVKGALEQQGLANTRAILVEQDGSWRPKPETVSTNNSASRRASTSTNTEDIAFMPRARSNSKSASVRHEVIDLDSD